MKLHYIFILLMVLAGMLQGCEDVIDMTVSRSEPALVVEGWLTNKRQAHYIKLYYTKSIRDTTAYTPVTGAQLVLTDDAGRREELTEADPGRYVINRIRGMEDRTYTLRIITSEGSYQAVSKMPRLSLAPDTIACKYEERSLLYEYAGFYPLIAGQELEGPGDYVQFKLYRNGRYLNKAGDLNLFSDEHSDGRYIKSMELSVDRPFVPGDIIRVEAWSLTEQAYHFWNDLKVQLNNSWIYAVPLANTRTNLVKTSPESANVTGFFGTSMVQAVETTVMYVTP